MKEYASQSVAETHTIAAQLAPRLSGGSIVLLSGELGAGKTTFMKGVASYFDIDDIVSPTFTLLNVYEIRSPKTEVRSLIHIDTYRLKNEQELIDIGVEDYMGAPDTICVIEWPEKLHTLLKGHRPILVTFSHLPDGGRTITITDDGATGDIIDTPTTL